MGAFPGPRSRLNDGSAELLIVDAARVALALGISIEGRESAAAKGHRLVQHQLRFVFPGLLAGCIAFLLGVTPTASASRNGQACREHISR